MQYVLPMLLLVALLVGGLALLNRPHFVPIDAKVAPDFPSDGFSHLEFEDLLKKYVDEDGNIDYDEWRNDDESVAQLESYLAAVAAYSPDNTPGRFATRNDELAYWIYGYNAYVIWSVLDNWPIESVTDVKAPLEVVSDPKNVTIDHANKQVVLSTIFKWFRKDFLNDLARQGRRSELGVIDYVASVAPDTVRTELDSARGYDVVFRDYDWSLNRVE